SVSDSITFCCRRAGSAKFRAVPLHGPAQPFFEVNQCLISYGRCCLRSISQRVTHVTRARRSKQGRLAESGEILEQFVQFQQAKSFSRGNIECLAVHPLCRSFASQQVG